MSKERTRTQREPYVDRIGQPHGRSGDKLVRKAMQGKIGVRHRGPYFAWHASAR